MDWGGTISRLLLFALALIFVAGLAGPASASGGSGGRDRATTVGESVEVQSKKAGPAGRPGAKLRWRVVKKRRGAKVKLTHRRSATPEFKADRIGIYVLRLTVKRKGRTSRDRVKLAVRPDDPPIGVPLETLSDDPAGAIKINGTPVKDTTDRSGIFVAVLDRVTRQPVESGTTPRHRGGLDQLKDIAKKWSGTDGYVMIVSGAHGIFSGDLGVFDELRDRIGAHKTTPAERSRLSQGQPFSMIGIPGGANDSAWSNIGQRAGTDGIAGDIRGYLQVNRGSGTGWYDYVPPERLTFDTQAGAAQSGTNTIRVGKETYEATLPGGASDGLHILVLDGYTLEPLLNRAMATNGADAATQQSEVANLLQGVAEREDSRPLVIVQSIGRPKGVSPGWAKAADQIERLGGTRLVFTALDGARDYALVGGPDAGVAAVEGGTTTGDGSRVGGLQRVHDLSFKPTVGGPHGGVNTELIDISYQAPTPFPAFEGAGERNAETYIGKKINLCAAAENSPCPIRPFYYKDREGELLRAELALRDRDLDYPGDGFGFTREEYDGVRDQLKVELSAVNRVREYFDALRAPFDKASQAGRVNLKAIGDEIFNAVKPPPADNTTSRGLELAGKLASLSGLLPPPFSNIGKGIGSILGLAGFLTRADGSTLLADEVKVKADSLAEQFQQRMFDASNTLGGLELLYVSDYGKLTSTASKLPTSAWKLDEDTESLNNLGLASKRWYAEQLVPVAYPWPIRGTPPPAGPAAANGLICDVGGHPPLPPPTPDPFREYVRPWAKQPANAQFRAVEGWEPGGQPVRPTFLFGRRGINELAPAQSVADLLFNPVNPRTGTLGIDKLSFISPKVFGKLRRAEHLAWPFCGLTARQSDSVREGLAALGLDPPPLFPEQLPPRLELAEATSRGEDHYKVTWDRFDEAGEVVLSRGPHKRLKKQLRAARRHGSHPRKVRVGSRKRWLLCRRTCGYAWIQNGRTYGVFGKYPKNSDAALKRDERALIRQLRPVA